MTTRRAELRRFSLELASPLRTANGTITEREGVLVRLKTDDWVGVGEATPLPGWTEPLAETEAALERAVSLFETRGADAALAALDGTPAAAHGFSLALLDGRGRAAGEPLYRRLGSERTVETVPVNATLGDEPLDATVAAATRAVEAGFDALKLKVGARTPDADAARLAAVREAVGPAIELRADANGAWSRPEAREAFERFADAGVVYVEQPLSPDDLAGHAALRGGSVGVALDESLSRTDPTTVLAARAADVLVLKPMSLGGVSAAASVGRRAIEAGVTPVVTTTVDAVVARTAAVHLAAALAPSDGGPACGLATAERLATDLAPDPAPVESGAIRVPEAGGHGVALDWDSPDSEHVSTGDPSEERDA